MKIIIKCFYILQLIILCNCIHERLYPFHDELYRKYHEIHPYANLHSPQLLPHTNEPIFMELDYKKQPKHYNWQLLEENKTPKPQHLYDLSATNDLEVLKDAFVKIYKHLYNISNDDVSNNNNNNNKPIDTYDWSWMAWIYRDFSKHYNPLYAKSAAFITEQQRLKNITDNYAHNKSSISNSTQFLEAIASSHRLQDKSKEESQVESYTFLDGGEYGHITCKTCVFVLERLKMGDNIMLAEICQEVYFRFPDQYEECIETIKAITLMGNEVRYWLWMGCYKYEMYLTREWVKPCPSHVICAALRNMFNQPFCRPLPVEMPFVNDKFPVLQKGGTPRTEFNVGYDEENIYSLRHDTDSNDQREATVKEKRESRDGGFDEQTTEPPPQRELKLARGPNPTNIIKLGAHPKQWQLGRDQTWAWQSGPYKPGKVTNCDLYPHDGCNTDYLH